MAWQPDLGHIHIPAGRRTTAEEYYKGDYDFQYDGQGGLSWTIPYLSGVLALGWQIRPELSGEEMIGLVFSTSHITGQGEKIIDPAAFIAAVTANIKP
jgi:hypothetical protein